jgi:hypothetical protein
MNEGGKRFLVSFKGLMKDLMAALEAHMEGDPTRPVCTGCGKRPEDLSEYVEASRGGPGTPSDYVRDHEGTFNRENGHFLCSQCYVDAGMPSGPGGWVAP